MQNNLEKLNNPFKHFPKFDFPTTDTLSQFYHAWKPYIRNVLDFHIEVMTSPWCAKFQTIYAYLPEVTFDLGHTLPMGHGDRNTIRNGIMNITATTVAVVKYD